MKSRYFWEKSTLSRFSIVFEAENFVHGRDGNNQFRSFRKDTGAISFSEREILEMRLAELRIEKEIEADENNDFGTFLSNKYQICFIS